MPAQAVRCSLDGLNMSTSNRSAQWNKHRRPPMWPKEASNLLHSYIDKRAVIFVEKFMPGDIGKATAKEFIAYVVM